MKASVELVNVCGESVRSWPLSESNRSKVAVFPPLPVTSKRSTLSVLHWHRIMYPDDRGCWFLWNFGTLTSDYVASPPRKQNSSKYRMLEFSEVWTLLNWRTCRTVEVTPKILLTASSWTTVHGRIYCPGQLNDNGFIQRPQVFTCLRNISYPQVSDPLLQASHMRTQLYRFLSYFEQTKLSRAATRLFAIFSKEKSHNSRKNTQHFKSDNEQNQPHLRIPLCR